MKRLIIISILICIGIAVVIYGIISFGLGYLITKVSSITPVLPTATSRTVKNVTYCAPNHVPQMLDLYIPEGSSASYPAIVYVHGGSWVSGSKDEEAVSGVLPSLANTGYVIAAINYRLAPTYTFPAQIEDVKCAVRFLRAHAQQYHINPVRMGMIGESAGGYLSAFSGVTGNLSAFETSEYSGVSDQLQAVTDISGPVDFTGSTASTSAATAVRTFLGSASPIRASVTTYITKAAPPFLIVHGQDDTVVPPSQSMELTARLTAEHIPATLIMVQHAGHAISETDTTPSRNQLAIDILSFFQRTLKN